MHKSKSNERASSTKTSKAAQSALVSFNFQFGSFSHAVGIKDKEGNADGSKEGRLLGTTDGSTVGTTVGISLGYPEGSTLG
jgi:hypothetical protein